MRILIKILLLITILFASSLVAFGLAGLWTALLLTALAFFFRGARTASVICILILVVVVINDPDLLPFSQGRSDQQYITCLKNLFQIAVSLDRYKAAHDSYPPAYQADADGKPLHSWRVLILKPDHLVEAPENNIINPTAGSPVLESELSDPPDVNIQKTYGADYDFDEPWNGPNNEKLKFQREQMYCCPKHNGARDPAGAFYTDYFAIVAPESVWPGSEPNSQEYDPKIVSNTVVLVEIPGKKIPWTEPKDVSLDDVLDVFAKSDRSDNANYHRKEYGYFYYDHPAINVLTGGDGLYSVPVDLKMSPEDLRKLFTVGGFVFSEIENATELKLRWDRIATLAVVGLSFLALAFLPIRMDVPIRHEREYPPD
jgi:hypothetical protein